MFDGWLMKRSWNGRHFVATPTKEKGGTSVNLLLREQGVNAEFTEKEWGPCANCSARLGPHPRFNAGSRSFGWNMASTPEGFPSSTREERCLRHREWRRTRHPQMGAAERRWLTHLRGAS